MENKLNFADVPVNVIEVFIYNRLSPEIVSGEVRMLFWLID
jgi:hypothetical protein